MNFMKAITKIGAPPEKPKTIRQKNKEAVKDWD